MREMREKSIQNSRIKELLPSDLKVLLAVAGRLARAE